MDPDIKEAFDHVNQRLDNVEGYFDGFGRLLGNHMTDYDRKLTSLRHNFTWGFWVIFGLTTVAIGGLIAGAIALVFMMI